MQSNEPGTGTPLTPSRVARASVPALQSHVTTYRRRLPHWRLDGATYFATWRVDASQRILAPDERTLVATTLQHHQGQRFALHAYVVMDDHVHVLVEPFAGQPLERLIQSWKSFSAHRMQQLGSRQGRVWQPEYFDRIVRSKHDFEEKRAYIRGNAFKRWPELESYDWFV